MGGTAGTARWPGLQDLLASVHPQLPVNQMSGCPQEGPEITIIFRYVESSRLAWMRETPDTPNSSTYNSWKAVYAPNGEEPHGI